MDKAPVFINMALHAWNTQIGRVSQSLQNMPDEILLSEIAPGRNRGIYLIGHLIAIHDAMNEILGIGKRAHADLDEAFLKNPDKSGFEMPSVQQLKQNWREVHENLSTKFLQMQPEDWFKRHEAMSDEDFAKDPARNKLSVLINRTNHAAFHIGQLRLLK